jgi:hypothetical protein
VQQAQAEADIIFPRLHFNLKHPEYGGDYTANITELKDYVSGKLRRSLIVLCRRPHPAHRVRESVEPSAGADSCPQ